MSTIKKILMLASVMCFLCACTTPVNLNGPLAVNLNDPLAVSQAIYVKRDEFQKITMYVGPDTNRTYGKTALLRAWRSDRDGGVTYQVFIDTTYKGDWKLFNTAFDIDGNQLAVTQIDRKLVACYVYGCDHQEMFGINLSRDYLQKKIGTGVLLKVIGKTDSELFSLPGAYIQGFLQKVAPGKEVDSTSAKNTIQGATTLPFDPSKLDQLHPGKSTLTDAINLFGKPNSETSSMNQSKLVQWIFTQATVGAHIAILFDKDEKMVRVEHKFTTGM